MIGSRNRFRQVSFGCALLAGGVLLATQAHASYTLTDNNSSILINPSVVGSTPAGMANWLVDGVNQAYAQWFYFRIGGLGPEAPIDSISGAPTLANQSTARSLDLTYANASYSARVSYSLTGNNPGSGLSGLAETITFQNLSGSSSLDLHFFDYSDFDLNGTPGGQSLQFYANAANQTNRFIQTFGASALTNTFSSTPLPAKVGHVEANLYPVTLASLTDGSPTTLNDITGAAGDVTGACEWDVTLGAGASLQISKLITMQVPEPSAMALLVLGGFAWVANRRRQAKL